jgi:hypothetical protein
MRVRIIQEISREAPGKLQTLFMLYPLAGTTFCGRGNESGELGGCAGEVVPISHLDSNGIQKPMPTAWMSGAAARHHRV